MKTKKRAARSQAKTAATKPSAKRSTPSAPAKATKVELVSTADERVLLDEAQRRGREVLAEGERLLSSYGAWLFASYFNGETAGVLDRPHGSDEELSAAERTANERWSALLESCGSAKFPLSRATVSNAVRVVAWDKRLADGAWSGLSFSHRVAMLPLNDAKAMRSAARHALASNLTVRATHEYVRNLLAPQGPALRLSPTTARKRVLRLSAPFEDQALVQKLGTQLVRLDSEARKDLQARLEHTVEQVQKLLSALKKR